MKNLKITLFLTILFSINCTLLQAQQNDKKAEMIAEMKVAKEKLALSDTQEITFKEVTKKYGLKMKNVKDSDASKRDKFKNIKSLRDEKNAEMKTLLSEEQYKAYLELQEERMAKMKDRKNK